jgi:uncharacterized surface protein with fasciclin (FAS1) repeats
MNRSSFLTAALVAPFVLGACSDAAGPTLPTIENVSGEARSEQASPQKGGDPIAAIAIDQGFGELVGALTYVDQELGAGLVELFLEGRDQYTVFAPTDEAFEELYALLSVVLGSTVDEITDLPAPVVLDVLLYHVTEGRRAANSVVPRNGERTITSLLGETFAVRKDLTIRDGLTGLRDDAAITGPNVSASNGIIHVINQVIVPPSVVAALTS